MREIYQKFQVRIGAASCQLSPRASGCWLVSCYSEVKPQLLFNFHFHLLISTWHINVSCYSEVPNLFTFTFIYPFSISHSNVIILLNFIYTFTYQFLLGTFMSHAIFRGPAPTSLTLSLSRLIKLTLTLSLIHFYLAHYWPLLFLYLEFSWAQICNVSSNSSFCSILTLTLTFTHKMFK